MTRDILHDEEKSVNGKICNYSVRVFRVPYGTLRRLRFRECIVVSIGRVLVGEAASGAIREALLFARTTRPMRG